VPAAQPLHALLFLFQFGHGQLALGDLLVDLGQVAGALGPELDPLGRPRLDVQPFQPVAAGLVAAGRLQHRQLAAAAVHQLGDAL
jgi:hypothetical protein